MDPGDREIAVDPALVADSGLDADSAAIRISGIRETFEESGIMLARPRGSEALVPAAQLAVLEPQRSALDEGKISFADICVRARCCLRSICWSPLRTGSRR